MAELDRYIPGVPCWIDHSSSPTLMRRRSSTAGCSAGSSRTPCRPGSPGKYFMARLRRRQRRRRSARRCRARPPWRCGTPTSGSRAPTTTAAKVREAGGSVLTRAVRHLRLGPDGVVRRPRGRGVRRLAAEPAPRRDGRQRARQPQLQRPQHPRPRAREGVLRRGVRLGAARRWACGRCPSTATTSRRSTRARASGWPRWARPTRFEDVVASLNPIPDDQPDTPAHWSLTFGVDDADAVAQRATELGGTVLVPPFDAPWIRMTVIRDPQGATFIANKFVPENRDLGSTADSAATAS